MSAIKESNSLFWAVMQFFRQLPEFRQFRVMGKIFRQFDYLWPNLHQWSLIQKNWWDTFHFEEPGTQATILLQFFISTQVAKRLWISKWPLHIFPKKFANPKFGVGHFFRQCGHRPLATLFGYWYLAIVINLYLYSKWRTLRATASVMQRSQNEHYVGDVESGTSTENHCHRECRGWTHFRC